MPLPINIDDLLNGKAIEWERLEFKEGWNPLDVLHTMCAFANDFRNLGGGYIIIGVKDNDGQPELPPKGLDIRRFDAIQKEILNLGNRAIQPPYHPLVVPVEIEGQHILVLWALGGQTRPYKARLSLSRDKKEFGYFIRKGSCTVRAKGADETELISLAATVPFDDRFNQQAKVNDLSRELMIEYLKQVSSDLAKDAVKLPIVELGRRMGVIGGPVESPFPLNVGLMMFHPEPYHFFPVMQIDVVWFPEGAGGDKFTEKIFRGPLPRMLREALDYIQRNYTSETVIKHPDRAEATRVQNFPYVAIEEAVVNAVYHRGYDTREPVEIRITQEDLVVLSFPGPDRSITLEQLRAGKAISRRYRNRRIGEFLKELEFTEGRSTGIPKIMNAMAVNSSPPAEFDFDEDHSYFLVRLPVNQQALRIDDETNIKNVTGVQSGVQSGAQSEMAMNILGLLREAPMGKTEIAQSLGKDKRTRYLNDLIKKMVASELIEYTIPDKQRSRLQQYRLTKKGLAMLSRHKKTGLSH